MGSLILDIAIWIWDFRFHFLKLVFVFDKISEVIVRDTFISRWLEAFNSIPVKSALKHCLMTTVSNSLLQIKQVRLHARGKDDKKDSEAYVKRSRQRIILQAAARAWSAGVPWMEALPCAQRAIKKASGITKGLPPRPKGKGRGKAKG